MIKNGTSAGDDLLGMVVILSDNVPIYMADIGTMAEITVLLMWQKARAFWSNTNEDSLVQHTKRLFLYDNNEDPFCMTIIKTLFV